MHMVKRITISAVVTMAVGCGTIGEKKTTSPEERLIAEERPDEPFSHRENTVGKQEAAPMHGNGRGQRATAEESFTHEKVVQEANLSLHAIRRAELNNFLARGPQHFLQLLDVRPVFRQGSFWGWRVLRYSGPESDNGPKITRGDIVRDVNGNTLEHPEDLMTIWQKVAQSPQLLVHVQRGGRDLALAYEIIDQ